MATPSGAIRQVLPAYKRTLSSRIKEASDLLQNPPDQTDTSACLDYVETLTACQTVLITSLQKITDQDQRWHEILQNVTDEEILQAENTAYQLTAMHDTSGYHGLIDNAETVLARIQARIARFTSLAVATQSAGVHTAASAQPSSSQRSVTAHLPKLTLPSFDGDILKFPEFWSMFQASVDSRSDIPPVTKLTYLLPLLKGAAEQAVKGYQLTDDNYGLIVKRLHERFHRTDDRYVSLLHAELKKISPCSGKSSEKRRTLDACERIFRLLEQAGESLDPGKSLVFELLGKFPMGMIRDLDKHYRVGVYSSLSEVRKAIERSITDDELTSGFMQDLMASRQQNAGRPEKRNGDFEPNAKREFDWKRYVPETTMAFNANRGWQNDATPPCGCYFCGGSHYNSQCTRYTNAYARRKRLQALDRCVKCLRRHRDACTKPNVNCSHCGKQNDHHPAICYTGYPSQKASNDTFRREYVPPSRSRPKSSAFSAKQKSERTYATFTQSEQPSSNTFAPNHSNAKRSAAEMVNFSHARTRNSLFLSAKVTAVNLSTGKEQQIRLCLDTLSNRSYITDTVARSLNLRAHTDDNTLYVNVFGSNKQSEFSSSVVSFGLRTNDGAMMEIEANTIGLITDSPILPTNWPEHEEKLLRSWQGCLADNPFDSDKTVDVLIGADYLWDMITGAKTTLHGSNVHLVPTLFGFMLAGQLHYDRPARENVSMLILSESPCAFPHEIGLISNQAKPIPPYPDVDEFWNLESIGIGDCPLAQDDAVAQKSFDDTVKYDDSDGRYCVKWPWIPEKRELLPTNFQVAYNRFQSLTKRLNCDPNLLDNYRNVIRQQVADGIIELVPDGNKHPVDHPTHYLPHHPVLKKESETTKTRIVFDASSKTQKLDASLNECLYRGPIILPDLVNLLLRFRCRDIVVISDIEKAFLQIALQREDRDVTRFFWYADDSHPSMDPNNMVTYRFRRVPFGVISSPFLLGATIQHHLKRENSELAESLSKDIYVDNLVSGLSTTQSPIDYYHDVKTIFARAGMNMQQFCSNSEVLMSHLPDHDKVSCRKVKVLGIVWNSFSDSDTLQIIRPSKWDKLGVPTKRGVLQCLASIFDPLGVFQPVTFPAKTLLQDLWIAEAGWDEPLPNALQKSWEQLRTSLNQIFDWEIPRFIGEISPASCLMVFGDASVRGYGACVYLRSSHQSDYRVNLIFAKTKLAPIQRGPQSSKPKRTAVTLPRLELLASTVAANIAEFCRQSFPNTHLTVHLFTDSECVLQWICSTTKLQRFVQRRVDKIRSLPDCHFHYVSTHDNPADLLTRGSEVDELRANNLWWHGPSWLKDEPADWPKTRLPSLSSEDIHRAQCRAPDDGTSQTLAVSTVKPLETGPFGIPFSRFSCLQRLLRVSWLCLKLLKLKIWNRISKQLQDRLPHLKRLFEPVGNTFDADGHNTVLYLAVRCVQRDNFPDELSSIQQKKKTSLARQLNLHVDQTGLLRTVSRFQHADLPQTAKVPVLLPKNHDFSRLVVLDAHSKLKHSGVSSTLSEIRQRFWIPSGRMYVQKVLKPCVVCRRFKRTETFALPEMPPWPSERVQRSAPFQFVGIDYFGPLKVKVNAETQKMWACIFTCLSTRAIHLEPVTDQTPAEFLKALIRFVSRRGCPQQIISDNGAQFRLTKLLGDRAWAETPADPTILSYSAEHAIQWKFIIELAPWQGGHYERLVGVVKSVLKTAIGRRLLTWTDLVTLLTETEAIVNCRPITYVTSDAESGYRVLRPVDFLIYRPCSALPPTDSNYPVHDLGEGGKQLASIWKSRERHLQKLWSIWYDDYLLSLRERSSMYHRNGRVRINRTPTVGEIVLLREENVPRGSWRMARVTSLIRSADSQVRAAQIKLANGVTVRRAVNFLLPLEVGGQSTPSESDQSHSDGGTESLSPAPAELPQDGHAPSPTQSDHEEPFFGFSQSDVDRAADLLNLYHDPVHANQQ